MPTVPEEAYQSSLTADQVCWGHHPTIDWANHGTMGNPGDSTITTDGQQCENPNCGVRFYPLPPFVLCNAQLLLTGRILSNLINIEWVEPSGGRAV